MNTFADKIQKNKRQSVANAVSQRPRGGESAFQFVDNRPETIAQRKMQEIANNSPRVKQTIQLRGKTTENVIQLVEAGDHPIRVNKGDEDNQLSISGLINCVGVVIMIYGEGNQAFDHVAVVGGHFVTPNMYRFGDEEGFTDAGQTFIDNINFLINGIGHDRLETTFYVKAPAMKGAIPESLDQATTAATAIRNSLGLGGQIEQVADNISVSV